MSFQKSHTLAIRPFSRDYDRRYERAYESAIEAAGFRPYRADHDLKEEDLCVPPERTSTTRESALRTSVSEDNPNVWFELGYAWGRQLPLVMVCSDKRTRGGELRLPFDVRGRHCIRYDSSIFDDGSPSDQWRTGLDDFKSRLSLTPKAQYQRITDGDRSSFRYWCGANVTRLSRTVAHTVDLRHTPADADRQIGDALLLLESRYPHGYPDIRSNKRVPESPEDSTISCEKYCIGMTWIRGVESLGEMKGRKLCVRTIVPDLTDTILRVETELVQFKDVRALHEVLGSDRDTSTILMLM